MANPETKLWAMDGLSPDDVGPGTICLTLKSAYGITRAYPSNTLAEQLAEFAQVVTFTQRHIMMLNLMGFTLKVTDGLDIRSVP